MPHYRWSLSNANENDTVFAQSLKAESDIISLSFGKGVIVLFENGTWAWSRVTKHLDNKLRGRQKILPKPIYVAIDVGNRYYIRFKDGEAKWKASRSFSRAVNESKELNGAVSCVAFAPKNGWCILFQNGRSAWNHLPPALHTLLKLKKKCLVEIKKVAISPDGYWFVIYKDGGYNFNISPLCLDAFSSLIQKSHAKILDVCLGKNGSFCFSWDFPGQLRFLSPLDISFSKTSIPAHFDAPSSASL